MSLATAKRQEKGKLVHAMRAHDKRIEAENRLETAEEREAYGRMEADLDAVEKEIEQLEAEEKNRSARHARLEALERDLREPIHEVRHQPIQPASVRVGAEPEFRSLFRADSPVKSYQIRALQADSSEAGGFTVPSQKFVAELIKGVDNASVVRGKARKFQLTDATSMGIPTLDADPEDGTWTAEIESADEDTQMDFGKRELKPHQLAKMIKVSRKLLRMSALPIEALVRDRLAYKFAVTEEQHFWTGTGAGQPLGMLTPSTDGVPTSRDVATGSATGVTADGLIDAQASVKDQYDCEWYFHRDAVKLIRKLKDSQGQYLLQPGLQMGVPDMLLGKPVNKSEYISNTFTNGLYVGIYGDLKFYWIADSLAMEIEREDHLYTLTNQVAFIARMEIDGQPVLSEAFARVKCSA